MVCSNGFFQLLSVMLTRAGCATGAIEADPLNTHGQSPLHHHCGQSRLDCALQLLAHSANVNLADQIGNTPLHLAVQVSAF